MSKNDCSNCSNQMTGFDGGFFGLPFTCECRIHGETENRKNCTEYEKKLTKSDLLMRINELEKENEQLRKELDRYKVVILQFVLLLVENGIMDSSVKEEVDGLLEELSGDGV